MQSSNSENVLLKPQKIAIFGLNLCKKRGQYGPHPKQTENLFAEMTKADHKLSKTFYFIKISYVLTELWMFFYFVVMFFCQKAWFPAITAVLLRQKLGQQEPHPLSSSIFYVEITKGHCKLSRTFIKIWVMNYFLSNMIFPTISAAISVWNK